MLNFGVFVAVCVGGSLLPSVPAVESVLSMGCLVSPLS